MGAAAISGLELAPTPDYVHMQSNKTPEFLAKFPAGKIPALEHPDTGFRLSEANAIMFYLADSGPKRDQLLGRTVEERALISQWMFFTAMHVEPQISAVMAPRNGWLPYNKAQEEKFGGELDRWFEYMEKLVKERKGKWLVGEDDSGPSLADLTVGAVVYAGCIDWIDAAMREKIPAIVEWYKSLLAVPELVNGPFAGAVFAEKRKSME